MSHRAFTRPWLYVALTLGWTWLFTLLAIPLSRNGAAGAVVLLRALGGIGPAVVAIALLYLSPDRAGRRDYWRRVVDVRRISLPWYAVILFSVLVVTLLAALLDRLLGGVGLQLEAAARFLDRQWTILPYAVFILFFGPFPEELGWRGYALDRLQNRWSALSSSLILGLIWVLWHLPLFFVVGTYQHGLGLGSTAFWTFNLGLLVSSVLYTWIYDNTGRSTLSAILFHWTQNFVGELFDLSARADLYQFGMWVAIAVVVVLVWGPKTLTLRGKSKKPGF